MDDPTNGNGSPGRFYRGRYRTTAAITYAHFQTLNLNTSDGADTIIINAIGASFPGSECCDRQWG